MKKISAIISVVSVLLMGFACRGGSNEGGATGYGLPFPWRFVNTSVNPPETSWAWYAFAIDTLIVFLLIIACMWIWKKADKNAKDH